jgi:hypothetical protein
VGGACGTHGTGEKSVKGFGLKARRKESTRITGAYKDGIRMDLRENGWGGGGWTGLSCRMIGTGNGLL